jgi:hypothetical protein
MLLVTGPKHWDHLIIDWSLINLEPKWNFSLFNVVVSGICYSKRKLTNTLV